MRCCFALPLLASVATCLVAFTSSAEAQQSDHDRFELHGTVIDAATGQPIADALVQLAGDRAQFTNSDGMFAFSDVPRGGYLVTAKKPGFFNDLDLGRPAAGGASWKDVPSDGDLIVELTREGIIYGEVTSQTGQPLDGITVRAQAWQVVNGRKHLQTATQTTTDDEGNFRLAELKPGNYYLSFKQVNWGWTSSNGLPPTKRKQQEEGFGLQFYPGTADPTSATIIPVQPSSQLHMSQVLSPLRLFEISGRIVGASPEGGLNLNVMSGTGDDIQTGMRLDPRTGDFRIRGVPAGNYMLLAVVFNPVSDEPGPDKLLRAWLPLSISSDISGLLLPLGRPISLGVELRDETSSGDANGFHQVSVQMMARDFVQFSAGIVAPTRLENGRLAPGRIEDVAPATYSVEVTTQFPGYVSDLRCGAVDLLQDDLTIAPGASLRPIEVTVRDDGADLDGTVTENGRPARADVVIFSPDFPKRSLLIHANRGPFSAQNIPPGRYFMFALDDAGDLEFKNPKAVEQYLSHATSVTLGPRDKSTARLEIHAPEEQP